MFKWTEESGIGWNPLMTGYRYLTTTERVKLNFTTCVSVCVYIFTCACDMCIYMHIQIYMIHIEILFLICSERLQ